MSRTRRKGWSAITGSDADNRGIKHHATNDWYSKKSECKVDAERSHSDGYWGRDKRGVKQTTRRIQRRRLNSTLDD